LDSESEEEEGEEMDEEERKERKEQRQKQRVRQLILKLFSSYFRGKQFILWCLRDHTANNFGIRYSRKRISQNSFPNIFSKPFMIFCQELQDPKRNYENQI
jgi:hypothetical protein